MARVWPGIFRAQITHPEVYILILPGFGRATVRLPSKLSVDLKQNVVDIRGEMDMTYLVLRRQRLRPRTLTGFKHPEGTIACHERRSQGLTISKMIFDHTYSLKRNVSHECEVVMGYPTRRVWSGREISRYHSVLLSTTLDSKMEVTESIKQSQLKMGMQSLKHAAVGYIRYLAEPVNLFRPWIYSGGAQRVHSTRLLERDLVIGKRWHHISKVLAEGKGPKSMDLKKHIAYSYSKRYSSVRSNEIIEKPYRERLTYDEKLFALWGLSQKPGIRAQGLFNLMKDINLWIAAYKKLDPNPGSMTKGGDDGTIDGTSMKSLEALRDSVSQQKFNFGFTRRVYIPKPKGGHRPLGIPRF